LLSRYLNATCLTKKHIGQRRDEVLFIVVGCVFTGRGITGGFLFEFNFEIEKLEMISHHQKEREQAS